MPIFTRDLIFSRPKSSALFERMCQFIPGGVNSPIRNCKAVGQLPLIVVRGEKDRVYDIDEYSFIDFCCSWGALIHGHAHPRIIQKIQQQASLGTTYGISCTAEEALARKVVELVPSIDKVRFVSTGTEATMTAVRLARGYTGKEFVIKFAGHYHGHADFFLIKAGSGMMGLTPSSTSAGIPDSLVNNSLCLKYNDIDSFLQVMEDPRYKGRIAAVILEPIAGNMGVVPADPRFLEKLREETQKQGIVLIFDEVITGFRVGIAGAQERYDITPDLTCLGKIVGGGLPAAAVGGRKEIMDCLAPLGNVYQAGTLSGNPLAMVAGYETLCMLEENKKVYAELEEKANIITKPVQALIKKRGIKACVQQVGSMFTLFFGRTVVTHQEEALELDKAMFAQFFTYMLERGIYIPPLQVEAWFVSTAHEEENLLAARNTIIDFIQEYV